MTKVNRTSSVPDPWHFGNGTDPDFLLFCLLIEGSGSVPLTNRSGCPKTHDTYGTMDQEMKKDKHRSLAVLRIRIRCFFDPGFNPYFRELPKQQFFGVKILKLFVNWLNIFSAPVQKLRWFTILWKWIVKKNLKLVLNYIFRKEVWKKIILHDEENKLHFLAENFKIKNQDFIRIQ